MSWDDNPLYHPEKHGLTLVAEVELSEPCYSFDTLAVWRGPKGYYMGTDSGCSCPTPFESYNGVEDMTGPLTVDGILDEASALKAASYEPKYDIDGFNEFVRTVRASETDWLRERAELTR